LSLRIFNLHVRLPLLLLALLEGLLLLLVPHLVTWLGLGSFGDRLGTSSDPIWAGSLVFAALGLLSLLAVGLYSTLQRADITALVVRVFVAISAAVVLSSLVFYFLPGVGIGRRTLAVASAFGIAGCVLLRLALDRFFQGQLFKRRVLVFGAGQRAATLLDLRRRSDTHGFRLMAFVAAEGDQAVVPADRQVERPADLLQWALNADIDEIVLAMDDRRRGFPMDELLECRLAGIDVLELPAFLERETSRVRLDVVHPSWLVLGGGFHDSALNQVLGRAFDLVVSAGLLIPALPVMLLTALAIRIEDGWRPPILYRQTRVGRHNRPFEVLKFRSMRENAEEDGAVWATEDDPRITRVGRCIRKLRIDELPQLWNVLRGDMSVVGPRPERPEFVAQLAQSLPFYRSRHAVKPGITGWAQVCYPYGASDADALEKLQYDLYYVKHRNLLFDLAIVLQTVEVVLWSKGAR